MADSTINLRPPVWALLAAVFMGGLFYIGGKNIEARDPREVEPFIISVSGEGKVSAVPDIAMLSLGVQTDRLKTAKEATDRLKADMNKIIAAVKQQGVAAKDITTEYFSLFPVYDYSDGRQVPRGFQASQSLRVKVRNLDNAGVVLNAATDAGANQAGGITFTIDEPETLQSQARQEAVEEAKEKAKDLARDLGMSLGELKGFSEGGVSPPSPYYNRAVGMGGEVAAQDAKIDLPSGEQEIRSTVTLQYELE